jgi:hypothetical protein
MLACSASSQKSCADIVCGASYLQTSHIDACVELSLRSMIVNFLQRSGEISVVAPPILARPTAHSKVLLSSRTIRYNLTPLDDFLPSYDSIEKSPILGCGAFSLRSSVSRPSYDFARRTQACDASYSRFARPRLSLVASLRSSPLTHLIRHIPQASPIIHRKHHQHHLDALITQWPNPIEIFLPCGIPQAPFEGF